MFLNFHEQQIMSSPRTYGATVRSVNKQFSRKFSRASPPLPAGWGGGEQDAGRAPRRQFCSDHLADATTMSLTEDLDLSEDTMPASLYEGEEEEEGECIIEEHPSGLLYDEVSENFE